MADTLAIEQVDVTQLMPAPYNPRTMTTEARKRLERGIREFGLVDPIIARRSDNLVIGGHQRLTAAQSLGLSTVPVVYLNDLSDDQAASLNILLNNPAAQGEWDMPKLTDILSELDGHGFDATMTGFDEEELAKLLGVDPSVPDEPQIGDVQFQVIVTCATEWAQGALCAELEGRGLSCRLLTL